MRVNILLVQIVEKTPVNKMTQSSRRSVRDPRKRIHQEMKKELRKIRATFVEFSIVKKGIPNVPSLSIFPDHGRRIPGPKLAPPR